MSTSPAKRQRTSVDTYVARQDRADEPNIAGQRPTTPSRRASYLSPTKASLARSHPNLLARPSSKAAIEPEVSLGTSDFRTAEASGETSAAHPTTQIAPRLTTTAEHSAAGDLATGNGATSMSIGFAQAITQAFEDVPSQSQSDQSLYPPTTSPRAPLSARQPRNISRLRQSTAKSIQPVLVTRLDEPSRLHLRAQSDEPELPPTPVQLGLSQAPERPRGLASSSAAGSRSGGSSSGSGKHRRRIRVGQNRSNTSSPLKPRHTQPLIGAAALSQPEAGKELMQDAVESDSEEQPQREEYNSARIELSEEVKQKQDILHELQAELKALENDLSRLNALADDLETSGSLHIDETTLRLIVGGRKESTDAEKSNGASKRFVDNPSAYLKLFSPANLQLQHTTQTKQRNGQPKTVHALTAAAPVPWPAGALRVAFEVTIDASSSRIEHIAQIRDFSHSHSVLRRWIQHRLDDRLHQYDIGSLFWGSGKYFEATITRARILQHLSHRYDNQSKTTTTENLDLLKDAEDLNLHETSMLIDHLDTDKFTFKSLVFPSRQILLVYDIHLNALGTATPVIKLLVNGVSKAVQQGAQELFARLVLSHRPQDVTDAFTAVWQLLEFDRQDSNEIGDDDTNMTL